MKQGLYEQIINQITAQQLSDLDPALYAIGREKRDVEEARKLLSITNVLHAITRMQGCFSLLIGKKS